MEAAKIKTKLTDLEEKILSLLHPENTHGLLASELKSELDSWVSVRKISNILYRLKRKGLVCSYIGMRNKREVRLFERVEK